MIIEKILLRKFGLIVLSCLKTSLNGDLNPGSLKLQNYEAVNKEGRVTRFCDKISNGLVPLVN
jgi:hypothetical protein